MSYRFSKQEHLCTRKLIEKVVKEGKNVGAYPFRLKWVKAELNTKYPAQIALSVSKRNFKRSVDRNRIKRLMREVDRKNKAGFYETLLQKELQCALLLGYLGKEIPDYAAVEKGLILSLHNLEKNIVANSR